MDVAKGMGEMVAKQGGCDALKGKVLLTLFMEPSTRTASALLCQFATGMEANPENPSDNLNSLFIGV